MRVDEQSAYTSVWVVNADGTNGHPVSGGVASYAEYPKWSPDGRWIAFQKQTSFGPLGYPDDKAYELWVVRPDGSELRSLGAGAEFGDSLGLVVFGGAWAWSPDSKQIAYVHTNRSDDLARPTVNTVDLANGAKRTLTTGTYPVWSPDGTQLAFVERCRIWLVPAKGR